MSSSGIDDKFVLCGRFCINDPSPSSSSLPPLDEEPSASRPFLPSLRPPRFPPPSSSSIPDGGEYPCFSFFERKRDLQQRKPLDDAFDDDEEIELEIEGPREWFLRQQQVYAQPTAIETSKTTREPKSASRAIFIRSNWSMIDVSSVPVTGNTSG